MTKTENYPENNSTLIDWTARRAGGRITITGTDKKTRKTVKIVGVDAIQSGKPPIATDRDGRTYSLR